MATEVQSSDPKFLSRVNSLPIVTTAIDQLAQIYQYTKGYNPYVKYTLETAEAGMKTVAQKALPVVNKMEKPMGAIDSIACGQLDKLELNYPIVTKPTEEVVAETKKVYEATVKPHVDTVTSVTQAAVGKMGAAKQYSVDTASGVKQVTVEKVEAAKQYTVDTVTAVKDYGANKVSDVKTYTYDKAAATATYGKDKLDAVLETPSGKAVITRVDQALDKTAQYVDYYMPEDKKEVEEPIDVATEQSEHMKPTDQTFGKLATVSDKVKRRMYAKTLKELQYVKERSQETIQRLNFTVDLIDYAKKNLDGAKTKASAVKDRFIGVWNEVSQERQEEEGVEKADTQDQTLESRAIETARHLTSQLRRAFATMVNTVTVLPTPLQTRLNDAKSFTESLYNNLINAKNLEDVPSTLISQTRTQIAQLHETVTSYTEYIRNGYFGSWLGAKTVSEIEKSGVSNDSTEDIEMEDLQTFAPEEVIDAQEEHEVKNAADGKAE